MEVSCEIEIDINGEEIFIVDKKVLACFSGRFRKLFGKLLGGRTRHLKVIFQDFPGGAQGFELVTRFCYNNGIIEITPSNIVLLNSAAYFMEMGRNNSLAAPNLVDQTEKSLEGINFWTWSELLLATKQCQNLFLATSSSVLLEKVLDSLIGRLSLPTVASPIICFSDNFSSQFSSDISSPCSIRNTSSTATWWFEDLLFLRVDLFDKVIRMMVTHKLDHATIFKFLIFYLKSRLPPVAPSEKRQIMEVVISLLFLLDRTSLSCKGLFNILQIVSSLKRIRKCHKLKLERLIGSKLDQATLDHLLVRSPRCKEYTYDVNLILRLVQGYLIEGWIPLTRLKKVASLMDSFLLEVASDFLLKPSKFAALLLVLPDSARESCDKLYQAIDLYIELHTQLRQEEKIRLCCALNQEKLSAEALKHLSQNSKFPSRAEIQDFTRQQSKHESFYSFKTVNGIPCCIKDTKKMTQREDTKQVLSFPREQEHPMQIRYLKTQLQKMQWPVKELEKACMVVESQVPNVTTKQRLCNPSKVRSLPKLCSC